MIFAKVREIISDQFDVEEDTITNETTFDELGADSLDVVDLIISIEERFNIDVEDEIVEEICNVGDVVSYIEKKV
jgi:acyl carrier protein